MATRRKFVKTAAGLALVSCDLVTIGGCSGGSADDDDDDGASPTPAPTIVGGVMTLPLSDYPALNSVDGSVTFTSINPGIPGIAKVIVARVAASDFVCLNARCTHQGCTIQYSAGANTFPCNCHGSEFAADGAVLDGPAETPVDAYLTAFDGSVVTVDFNTTI